ncbi:MAG: polysaccharide deacetylase family protein [Kibdelosporangium sp.]
MSRGSPPGHVALTYDDGPNPHSTEALLKALREVDACATFFTLGGNQQHYPELVRAIRAAGMWIGNHTWSHPHLPQISRDAVIDEIRRTQQMTRQITGQAPTLFRPPYGDTNDEIKADAAAQGLTQVLWSVDTKDWNGATTERIVQAAATVQPGGIILMHDGGYRTTVAAVPLIVRGLAARGLRTGRIIARNGRPVVVAP